MIEIIITFSLILPNWEVLFLKMGIIMENKTSNKSKNRITALALSILMSLGISGCTEEKIETTKIITEIIDLY